jgi:serine/threonine protein phosphatase PrpC
MTATESSCPACQQPLQAGDQFCESCGARVGEDGPQSRGCEACGAGPEAIAGDGVCTVCGVRAPSEGRIELDLEIVAAVSDTGLVHWRNEDSFFVEVIGEGTVAAVVCDGISSSSAANIAARSAASTAGAVLREAMADPGHDASSATTEAIQVARGAVAQVEWTSRTRRVDPSCTLVSALCREGEIVIGWVGDSRAYWVDSEGARQLTVDDSLAEEGVAEGLLTPEQAARSPFLHSITHWVGPASPARPPRIVSLRPDRRGRVVLCTDGFWNYAPSAAELGELVAEQPAGASAADVARALADIAVARGGRDNITVAVVDVTPA